MTVYSDATVRQVELALQRVVDDPDAETAINGWPTIDAIAAEADVPKTSAGQALRELHRQGDIEKAESVRELGAGYDVVTYHVEADEPDWQRYTMAGGDS